MFLKVIKEYGAKVCTTCVKSWDKREKNEVYFNFSERSNDSPKANVGQTREKMKKHFSSFSERNNDF